MKTTILIVLLLIVFGSPCRAQESALSAEELLHFFPLDDYEQIVQEETAAMMASKQFETFEPLSGFLYDRRTAPFPEEFMNEVESFTTARMTRAFVYVWKQGEKKIGSGGRTSWATMMDVGDVTYVAEGVGEDLFVLRFIDLPAVIKKYREAGVLVEMGESIGNLAVFTISHENRFGLERTVYLAAFETGELLAAEKMATLKRMVATGRGEEEYILGDPIYLTFTEALEYEGKSFTWSTIRHLQSAVLRYAEKRGNSPEEIKEAEDHVSNRFKDSVSVWDLSGPVVQREIDIFVSEEKAGQQLARIKGPTRATLNNISKVLMAARKYSIDGEKLIATITYDEETLKKFSEAREQDKKNYEERKKDAESKGNSEKKK